MDFLCGKRALQVLKLQKDKDNYDYSEDFFTVRHATLKNGTAESDKPFCLAETGLEGEM